MVLHKYANKIIEHIEPLTVSEMKILVYMALYAQFKDGEIHLNREDVVKRLKFNYFHVSHALKGLREAGLIEKLEGRSRYRVRITYPVGKHLIKFPKKRLFAED